MASEPTDFIRQRIAADLAEGVVKGGVVTRFPPEPNGYLHIGHAKSICLNFGIAEEYGGHTYLRFDDTNPLKESDEYVAAIQEDVAWLGYRWGDNLTHASDYFEQLYGFAEQLIERGKAYVCSLSGEQIRATRGTLTKPGTDSPYRDRSASENLDLFRSMRSGEFEDGTHVLRARIDMASPNLNMRDPVLYRIRHALHQRTGADWVVYPMYDFTHCICDALEGITHSLCTLEFEDHRPLYDWVLDNININFHPPQIEFSRLGLEYTVMSKRLLSQLVSDGIVEGWDDPRMPTLAGLRRRGVTPGAIREFCRRIGVTKQDNVVELKLLDFCIRQDLEDSAHRGMAVLDPLKVVITNYPNSAESLQAPWHPQQAALGTRSLPFGPEIYIEREDFEEEPPKKYKRLSPGEMVRLRYAYIIRCDEVVKDDLGVVSELRCSYFPDSKSGSDNSGLKPKGVVHWVSGAEGIPARIMLYDTLFRVVAPKGAQLQSELNAQSVVERQGIVEPAVMASAETRFQFERQGYFCKDTKVSGLFHRTVTLRDSWKPQA
ncbi:MAG: glutamine--tRNA ligase/YqeY domain fusion protein [Gammaproteobacteria bacterium]|nr:glutamine--tRNA ligase/YqeY domain fusion protein [Gammaproteobacteria bacterium]